jgi:hypothetical protein
VCGRPGRWRRSIPATDATTRDACLADRIARSNIDLVFAGLLTVIVAGLVVETFVFRWLERRPVLGRGVSARR